MPLERFTSAFSNANGSIGLCLATLALILVLTYGYLSFSDAVLAAEPIDLKARRPNLGYMTALEADYGRRILAAAILGALLGRERRAPDRAAGVRTMALVSVGACLFCISSGQGFAWL